MTNLKLAWRNLWRNKRRTIITVASIFFGVILCAFTRSMQEGSYEKLIENVVRFYSGYMQIHNEEYWENKSINNTFEITPQLMDEVTSIEEITEVFPRLESFALASSEEVTKRTLVMGIIPGKENEFSSLSKKVTHGRYLKPGDKGAIIGAGLAKSLQIDVNDTLVLLSQGYHGVSAASLFPVVGIVKLNSPELNRQIVYMDLPRAQDFYAAPNLVTSLVMNVDKSEDLNKAMRKLNERIESPFSIMSWDEMQPELVQLIESDRAGGVVMILILYMVIAFGILGTIMMMIAERKREFGVMVAIGMQKKRLSSILLFETLFISMLGVLTGLIGSLPVIIWCYYNPIPLSGRAAEFMVDFGFEPFMFFSVDPKIFINQAIAVLVIALIIGIYPLVASLRLNAIKAMHK